MAQNQKQFQEYITRLKNNDATLTELKLDKKQITKQDLEILAAALKENQTLQKLDLSWNNITAQGAAHLADALKENQTLQELDLGGNNITDKGAAHLAQALKENQTLQELNLWKNNITDEGAAHLAQALKENQTLQQLNLWKNNITDEGAAHLAQALKENQTLQKLNLGGNKITAQGAAHLAQAVKENQTLQKLDLYTNEITAQGAAHLAQALKENQTLRELYLGNNNITDQGAAHLAQALKENQTLQVLDLWRNIISGDLDRQIRQLIKRNKELAQAKAKEQEEKTVAASKVQSSTITQQKPEEEKKAFEPIDQQTMAQLTARLAQLETQNTAQRKKTNSTVPLQEHVQTLLNSLTAVEAATLKQLSGKEDLSKIDPALLQQTASHIAQLEKIKTDLSQQKQLLEEHQDNFTFLNPRMDNDPKSKAEIAYLENLPRARKDLVTQYQLQSFQRLQEAFIGIIAANSDAVAADIGLGRLSAMAADTAFDTLGSLPVIGGIASGIGRNLVDMAAERKEMMGLRNASAIIGKVTLETGVDVTMLARSLARKLAIIQEDDIMLANQTSSQKPKTVFRKVSAKFHQIKDKISHTIDGYYPSPIESLADDNISDAISFMVDGTIRQDDVNGRDDFNHEVLSRTKDDYLDILAKKVQVVNTSKSTSANVATAIPTPKLRRQDTISASAKTDKKELDELKTQAQKQIEQLRKQQEEQVNQSQEQQKKLEDEIVRITREAERKSEERKMQQEAKERHIQEREEKLQKEIADIRSKHGMELEARKQQEDLFKQQQEITSRLSSKLEEEQEKQKKLEDDLNRTKAKQKKGVLRRRKLEDDIVKITREAERKSEERKQEEERRKEESDQIKEALKKQGDLFKQQQEITSKLASELAKNQEKLRKIEQRSKVQSSDVPVDVGSSGPLGQAQLQRQKQAQQRDQEGMFVAGVSAQDRQQESQLGEIVATVLAHEDDIRRHGDDIDNLQAKEARVRRLAQQLESAQERQKQLEDEIAKITQEAERKSEGRRLKEEESKKLEAEKERQAQEREQQRQQEFVRMEQFMQQQQEVTHKMAQELSEQRAKNAANEAKLQRMEDEQKSQPSRSPMPSDSQHLVVVKSPRDRSKVCNVM